jgi:hypothetical protein
MIEEWKNIKGHSYYMVSNLGNVKSLARTIVRSDGHQRNYKEKLLNTKRISKYPIVALRKNGKSYWYHVHVLVGRAFVANYRIDLEINHKDGNKANSIASNLEWVTHRQNMIHCVQTGLRKYRKGVF